MLAVVIASVTFRNFKVLRDAQLALRPFNLVLGANGSGKTSLIQSLMRLRSLSQLDVLKELTGSADGSDSRITFQFTKPHETISAELSWVSDLQCDALTLQPADAADWPRLRSDLSGIRAFLFDHHAMAAPSDRNDMAELASNGNNWASVLAEIRTTHPEAYAEIESELVRIMPEFSGITFVEPSATTVDVALRLSDGSGDVPSTDLSQGTLYLLGILSLALQPNPPTLVCIEEIDRGIHPRLLREIRDLLYRLSYPEDESPERSPVQVIATTHSPYLLDLFRDHPEEVVILQKQGNAAQFECLADRKDLADILEEGSLGDIWFSGILGGVPEES